MSNKVYSLQIPDDLANDIKELAKRNNINFSNQVRLILSAYIRKIKEGTENAEGI